MTLVELAQLAQSIADRHAALDERLQTVAAAPTDVMSGDADADSLAEAVFLRTFTSYEADLERIFLHFVTGGATLNGMAAVSYLNVADEEQAKRLVRGAFRYLSWSKPSTTRVTADTYLTDGWPITPILAARSQDLSDCEKIRNRIAHQSSEAHSDFAAVQRNLFLTERLFPISPGQLLRTRFRSRRQLVIQHYVTTMRDVLTAMIDPPT